MGGALGLGLGLSAVARAQFGRIEQAAKPRLKFGAIGLNHSHIVGQCNALIGGGGALAKFHAAEDDLAAEFQAQFPQAVRVADERAILEDREIAIIASASIPDERAPLGIRAMRAGKDFMSDKPGAITLAQLADLRRVQAETGRIYSIAYSERFDNHSAVRASELIAAGAIGRVLQTVGLGPHRLRAETRPAWFWDRARFGGILCDIASHQIDQFLHYTGSTQAEVTAAQVANFHHKDRPGFEDFGDVMLRGSGANGEGAAGYCRVDWFTPDGIEPFGDGRLTIIGTDGYIELRKYADPGGLSGGGHLILVDNKGVTRMQPGNFELPYGRLLVDDVLNRTETAMTQAHCFLATELALRAQTMASRIA